MAKQGAITHNIIPKHKKLTEKEKNQILEQFHITTNELPIIHKSDPALAGMDIEFDDMIKIERSSPTAGRTIFYRVVSGE